MAAKRAATKKKAAASKVATKKSAAPAKKAAPRKAPSKPQPAAATRAQPSRRAKAAQPPAPEVQDDVEDELTRPASKRRAAKKKAASPVDVEEQPPPAPARKTTRGKRPAVDEDDEEVEAPRTKRPRRKEKAPTSEQQDASADDEEDLPVDDAENNTDCDLTDDAQLASVSANDIAFTLRGGPDVRLNFRLQVFTEPSRSDSRLFYRLRFFLTSADQEEHSEAGYIHAYRIAKPTLTHPNAESQTWLRDLLQPRLDRLSTELNETALCLRALFTQVGVPAPLKVRDADIRLSLRDNALLFIQMIHVRRQYQRQGLLTPLLQNWQSLLQRLPEWFAFRGNAVLVPGKPDNAVAAAVYRGSTEDDVEDMLTRAYRRQGFAVWVRDSKVGDNLITVMGKGLEPVTEAEEGGDGDDEDGGEEGGE